MAKTTKSSNVSNDNGASNVPKQEKSVKKSVKAVEPVVSSDASDVPVAPVEVKVKKVTKSKKVEVPVDAPTESSPSDAVPALDNVVVEASSPVEPEDEVVTLSTEFYNKLTQLGATLSSLKNDYKTMEKKWLKELKASQKLNQKKKRKANRAPSGFVKPTKISNELATFLGKPLGHEMARTEVTREINKYIRSNSLQDSVNGRKINPNAPLAQLLQIPTGEELTYFNLQRYMSRHFQKMNAPLIESA